MIALFAVGLVSMLAQVVMLREVVAALFGVDLLYILGLASWLVGTALGAAAGRFVRPRDRTVSVGFAAAAVLLPLEVAFLRTGGVIVGAVPGAYLPFPIQVAGIALATMPLAALSGALFQWAAALAVARGFSLGRSYAIESAGAATGGILVTLAFAMGVSTFQAALAVSLVAVAAATRPMLGRHPWRIGASGLVLAVAGAFLAQHVADWDVRLLRWQYPALVGACDTPYARVAVTGSEGQFAVFQNGALAFDTEGTSAEAFADIAALQHPSPARALVLGGGLEGVPDALAGHGLTEIVDVELDQRAFEFVGERARPATRRASRQDVVRVEFADPREYTARPGGVDLILLAMPEPTSGETSRFYTAEFFAQCAHRLGERGVLALRLPAAENFWPPALVRRTASIYRALAGQFASVVVLPGETLYMLASQAPLPTDPAVLAQRLAARHVRARLITEPFLRYLYLNDRRGRIGISFAGTDIPPNRDSAPVSYRYATTIWLSKFYPQLDAGIRPSPGARALLGLGAMLVGCACVIGLRRSARGRAAGFVFIAGAMGTVLETVLLLRYQISNGVVFQNVGWLLTCFMGGLAGGAVVIGRWLASRPPASSALAGGGLVCGLLALSGGTCVAVTLTLGGVAGLVSASILLAGTGAFVGGAFSYAGAVWPGPAGRGASVLYAADLAGGAAGAVAAALLLVPYLGLETSALAPAALAVLIVPFISANR